MPCLNERRAKAAQRVVVTIDDIAARLDDEAGAIQDREFLDQAGMMVENHNRKMTLPLLGQRTKLIRRLAAALGKDKADFHEQFAAREKLLERQRRGDGDPEELSAAIDQATEALYGKDPEATVAKLARDRGDADPAQAVGRFQSDASQADRIELRLTSSNIRAQQKPAEDAILTDVQPRSVERRSGGFVGRVRGMNNYVKMVIIIGISIILAAAINVYFSPFQTCKRELESSNDYNNRRNAALYCTRALGRGFR